MIITEEEKKMYEVMRAIYDSGIPINFKGAMVLKACLMEAGFPEETRHTVDIDVNRPAAPTKIYAVEGLRFRGVAPLQMIADKVSVASTDKVFRRVKDVIDLYYISKVFSFDKAGVMQILRSSEKELDVFNGFLHRRDELRHAYEKFRFAGAVSKPPFEEVYCAVKTFIKDVLPEDKDSDCER